MALLVECGLILFRCYGLFASKRMFSVKIQCDFRMKPRKNRQADLNKTEVSLFDSKWRLKESRNTKRCLRRKHTSLLFKVFFFVSATKS